MEPKHFSAEVIGHSEDVIQISFPQGDHSQKALSALYSFFTKKISDDIYKWIFDFSNMPFPTTAFIAFIISATQQVREKGGDLKIINAQDSSRNNFMTFSPLSYLAFEDNIANALDELNVELQPQNNLKSEMTVVVDIAAPPVAEVIDESNDEVEITTTVTKKQPIQKPLEQKQKPPISSKKTLSLKPRPQNNQPRKFYLKTESIASNLYKICDFVVRHSRNAGMEEKQIVKSKIAVYEACLNVIEHAYHSRPDNWIEVWVEYTNERFQIVIQDHGLSFEKSDPGDFDAEEAADKRQTGGFGIHIIDRSMDEVNYKADAMNGNRLTLIKYLK
jgi:anti-sigma regulatory factor (Ser/Thr protein kinase)/anti-anti-sigma regulatory factor